MTARSPTHFTRSYVPRIIDCDVPHHPRYEKNPFGGLDYVIDVDAYEFDPSDLKVSVCGYNVAVEANSEDSCWQGPKVGRTYKREIHLPYNVIPDRITSLYKDNGMLEIRCPAYGSKFYSSESVPNNVRFTDGYYSPIYNYSNVLKSEPNLHIYPHHSRSRSLSKVKRGDLPYSDRVIYPRSASVIDTNRYAYPYIGNDYTYSPDDYHVPRNYYSSHTSYPYNRRKYYDDRRVDLKYAPRRLENSYYVHKVNIDPDFKAEDITVLVENGVVVISANNRNSNRYKNDHCTWAQREFSCEHTLPNDVDSSKLKARILNGIIILEAPYRNYY